MTMIENRARSESSAVMTASSALRAATPAVRCALSPMARPHLGQRLRSQPRAPPRGRRSARRYRPRAHRARLSPSHPQGRRWAAADRGPAGAELVGSSSYRTAEPAVRQRHGTTCIGSCVSGATATARPASTPLCALSTDSSTRRSPTSPKITTRGGELLVVRWSPRCTRWRTGPVCRPPASWVHELALSSEPT